MKCGVGCIFEPTPKLLQQIMNQYLAITKLKNRVFVIVINVSFYIVKVNEQ